MQLDAGDSQGLPSQGAAKQAKAQEKREVTGADMHLQVSHSRRI